MTLVTPHLFLYKDRYYELVRPSTLFTPRKVGLFVRPGATSNPGGCLATFAIENGMLMLWSLLCTIDKPKGILNALKYLLRSYPPKIGDAEPEKSDQVFDVFYDRPYFALHYTGEIVIGIRPVPDAVTDFDPNEFTTLIKLSFDQGRFVKEIS